MSHVHHVKTGIPGIFYRRPSPSDPNFVEEGATVAPGDTIGLVEIMKSFHPVTADKAGIIVRFLVDNDGEVAPGQDLAELQVED